MIFKTDTIMRLDKPIKMRDVNLIRTNHIIMSKYSVTIQYCFNQNKVEAKSEIVQLCNFSLQDFLRLKEQNAEFINIYLIENFTLIIQCTLKLTET